MIQKIAIKDVATFKEKVVIDNLQKVNYFFGSNGSGKTTIGKVIKDEQNFSSCKVDYSSQVSKPKILIYNEDFVREYFYESENLKGIYTIGEGVKEIEEKIKEKNGERQNINKELENLNRTKKDKEVEKSKKWEEFKETCWSNIFQKYQNDFPEIFKGYGKSKEDFARKILEQKNNTSEIKTEEDLKNRYELLFNKNISKIVLLKDLGENTLENLSSIETNTILKTKIIGKEDIDIAKMIHKLQNHDWVRKGKEYLEKNYDETNGAYICPFCQQKTPDDFRQKLEEYFDETYEQQINELNNLINKYNQLKDGINEYFAYLKSIQDNQYYERQKDTIKKKVELISKILANNIQKLNSKREKPSSEIELDSLVKQINELKEIIANINNDIQKHNNLINDKTNQKNILISEIWTFFYYKIEKLIEQYKKSNGDIDKALKSVNSNIQTNTQKLETIKNEISELEKKIKSVKPTVENINDLLCKFNFQGFKLETTEDEKHYRIVRNGGKPAKNTLSEGERNFIVFLYFYSLVNGVLKPEENINESKIIVFDDPVSSLDSDVLFIVATLIKSIIKNARENHNNIQQIFLLTHNAYFFKEVTYFSNRDCGRSKRNDTSYFIVRKVNNNSKIDYYETNPIKTTYQLLWDEIKKEGVDCVSIQNSMRRIIEFYFNVLGDLKEGEILNKFEDETDKKICRSLISWMNVGSHDAFFEIDYSPNQDEVEKFKEVFKKIFEITGHIAHYNMMMGINEN